MNAEPRPALQCDGHSRLPDCERSLYLLDDGVMHSRLQMRSSIMPSVVETLNILQRLLLEGAHM